MESKQELRKDWNKPALTTHGSVESLTSIKLQGGFDGVEIMLLDGDIITGS